MAAAATLVLGIQLAARSFDRPGFGTDFQLLYTIASVWKARGNPYDDDALKAAWREVGPPHLPTVGRPVTPNVYPLTVAPLIAPLSGMPFRAALACWSIVTLFSLGYLIRHALCAAYVNANGRCNHSTPAPDGSRFAHAGPRLPAALILGAVAVLMLSYPTRLALASLNIALPAGALAVWAVQPGRRSWTGGAAMGLALVKYSLTAPLWGLLLWRRQYRTAAAAIAVHAALIAVASWSAKTDPPLHWLAGMRTEIAVSMASGAINAPDAARGTAMHLDIRSLWHRIAPGRDSWHVLGVAVVVGLFACAVATRQRGAANPACLDAEAALWALPVLLAFYHRAYDLVPILALVIAAGLRRATLAGGLKPRDAAIGCCLALTVVPGLWSGWDAPAATAWVRWLVQPACAWATLGLCVLLALPERPEQSSPAVTAGS